MEDIINQEVTEEVTELEKVKLKELSPEELHKYYLPLEANDELPRITRKGKIVQVAGEGENRIICIEFMNMYVFMFNQELPNHMQKTSNSSLINQLITFKPIGMFEDKIIVSHKEIKRFLERQASVGKILHGKIVNILPYEHDPNRFYAVVKRKGDLITIPYSELVHPLPQDPKILIGEIVRFIITEVKDNMTIGSIRIVYNFDIEQLAYLFQTEGKVTAVVDKIMKFGVVLKYKHMIPLIMRNKDYSSDYTPCSDILSIGDKVKVKFIEESPYNHNIFVGPIEKYAAPEELKIKDINIDQTYKGKVVGVSAFGCFVRIAPGQDVLCPISYNQRDPQVGDDVEVRIDVIREDTKRLKGRILGYYDEILDLSEFNLV